MWQWIYSEIILNQEKTPVNHWKSAAAISHCENTFEAIMHRSNRNYSTSPTPFDWPYYCKPIVHKYYISQLIYSILSKHMFTAVSDFSHRKKKTWQFRLNFPHHIQAEVKFPPAGRPYKSNSPHPRYRK